MANSIGLASKYVDLLDKQYKLGAKTSVLDVAPDAVKPGPAAGTFYVQKLSLVGLGNYARATGYVAGDATVTWEAHTYTYDRGRKFSIDAMDELEAMGVFAKAAKEFLRVHVTPEIDATRIGVIAGTSGISGTSAALSSAADWVGALNTAMTALDNAEVPEEDRILFINATGRRLIETQASTSAITDALDKCTVVTVPSARFNTKVALNAGGSASAGGFTGHDYGINFLAMDKGAAFADAKHSGIKVFSPTENQDADAWMFQYRIYHDAFVYENKVSGIYLHRNVTYAATPA